MSGVNVVLRYGTSRLLSCDLILFSLFMIVLLSSYVRVASVFVLLSCLCFLCVSTLNVLFFLFFFFLRIRRPPRSTRLTHSFPTRRSSDLSSLGRIDEPLRFLAGDHVGGLGVEIGDGRRKPVFLGIALGAHQLPDRDDSAVHDAEGRAFGRVEDLDDPETLKDLRVMLGIGPGRGQRFERSEEHTSELQSLMRISYAVFCLKKKKKKQKTSTYPD